MKLLDLKGIGKQYHATKALDGISLSVKRGEFLTVLGPNGAGKTTLLKIMSGIMTPTEGTVLYKDRPVAGSTMKREISYLGHKNSLYNSLTVLENIEFVSQLFSRGNGGPQIENTLKKYGLWERRNDPVKELSQGMKRRLAVARGFITEPQVYIMDEPFTGLDLGWKSALFETIRNFRNNGTSLILTTHLIEEGYGLADTIAFLNKGNLVFKKMKRETSLEGIKGLFQSLGQTAQ